MFPIANYFSEVEIDKVTLSVVVPAFNEEKRLPLMMDDALDHLEKRVKSDASFSYEVIVVDDGSTDKTSQVALSYSDKYSTERVRLLKLDRNRGKGGAVRLGVLSSRGRTILFADADGATTFSEIDRLMDVLKESEKKNSKEAKSLVTRSSSNIDKLPNCIVIGSRAHLEEEAIATRSLFRTLLMHGFHFIVWFFTVRTVRDTQCGFKLLPRHLALHLFSLIHVERWAFDVELLHVCERLSIPIVEVCVKWREIEGSKIVPVFSWLQMGRDVLIISFLYLIRAWKVLPVGQLNVTEPLRTNDWIGTNF
jgi:dolichyl-phosphate beta-glucosyltransferase